MRREPDFFGAQELELIYIAKRLSEAKAVEKLFAERSVDYLVEPDEFTGGVIFRTQRIGAFFYVLPAGAEYARAILTENGYKPQEL